MMEALRSRDMLMSGVTKTIDDLDETINLLGERLEHWYGIYFPELRFEDRIKFCKVVLVIDRENLDEALIANEVGATKATDIMAKAGRSLGAKLSPKDRDACLSLAKQILSLDQLRNDFVAYQMDLATELCPNMTIVGGADVAAKLVSHVGSLRKLAFLPASTIQVLGAEKALFKHLRNRRVPSPKHGIIFQNPKISGSPKAVRGKIARALSNALCTAAKADAFTKRDISAELKLNFEVRFDEIMKEYEGSKPKSSPRDEPREGNVPERNEPGRSTHNGKEE